jgi:hypothetical protein
MKQLSVAAAILVAACGGSGHVSGRVTQVEDSTPLAHVTLTLDGRRTHAQSTTDASGRFDFPDLAPGPYTLKAETPDFASETRDDIAVARNATATADFALHPACLEEGSYVDGGLRWGLQAAEAILYVRIASVSQPDRWIVNNQCIVGIDHTTTVLSILNMGPDSGDIKKTIHIVRDGRVAWKAGDEYIAFVRWETAIGRYRPIAGPIFMIPVKDGKVEWDRTDAPNIRTGDPISKAMAGLFALLPQKAGSKQ